LKVASATFSGRQSMIPWFTYGLAAVTTSALVLVACAAPETAQDDPRNPEGVELRVDARRVAAGESVTIRLVNGSGGAVGYNLCPAVLERRTAAAWELDPTPLVEVCTMELRLLPPGESAEYSHTIPPALAAGEYRFRVAVEAPLDQPQVPLVSNAFEVH
jgi:hypothetical protein